MTSSSAETGRDPTISGIWRSYRGRISITFVLLSLERGLGVAVPFLLGVAIDDLLEQSYRGVFWLIALELARLAIGVVRRLYDTRVYAGIYTDIADQTARNHDVAVTQRSARLQLGRELVDFFEWELPGLFASLISMGGALAMLVYLLPLIGGLSVAVAALIGLVFFASRKRILNLNKVLNNELERQVRMLESEREFARRIHLSRLARWRIHLSDLEAMNFGIAELLLGALVIGAVVITVNTGLSVGEVFAILTYLIELAESLIILPWTYQQSIRAQEIGSRISQG